VKKKNEASKKDKENEKKDFNGNENKKSINNLFNFKCSD